MESQKELDKIASKQCIDSLYAFLVNFWEVLNQGETPVLNFHIKYLCDLFTDQFKNYYYGLGEYERDIIVNVPPGSTKSTIFSQMAPVWIWLHAPQFEIITTSYGSPAIVNSIKSKAIIQHDKFHYFFQGYYKQAFGRKFRLTKNTEKEYGNNFGGRRYATTTGGALTGMHGHIIIRDDPMSQLGSMSEAERIKTHNFNDYTLPSRKKDKEAVPTWTIMQRLHEDDTTGHELEKDKKIFHVVMPASNEKIKAKPDFLNKYYKDNMLDPIRLSEKAMKFQRDDLGSLQYSGQYDQEPTNPEGQIVKKDWFEYCEEKQVPKHLPVDLWVDGAYTDKSKNDPTGLLLCSYDQRDKKLYVIHYLSKHMEINECIRSIGNLCDLYSMDGRGRVYIEPKASGKTIKQLLNSETRYSAVEIKSKLVQEGKEARIQTAAPKYEAGKVIHVRGSWNESFEGELLGYPRAKHDEGVDLIGYAVDKYYGKSSGIKRRN